MAHNRVLEAPVRILLDLGDNKAQIGEVAVTLFGDYRQTLPVISKGTKAHVIHACIKSLSLWTRVKISKLSVNIRVHLPGVSCLTSLPNICYKSERVDFLLTEMISWTELL